jgi:hypothetical protein
MFSNPAVEWLWRAASAFSSAGALAAAVAINGSQALERILQTAHGRRTQTPAQLSVPETVLLLLGGNYLSIRGLLTYMVCILRQATFPTS